MLRSLMVVVGVIAELKLERFSESPHPGPIWHLHVPKTGSSIEPLVFRAGCRILLQKHFTEPGQVSDEIKANCPDAFAFFKSGHAPLPNGQPIENHVVYITMLRTPWRRTLSGLFHNFHDCTKLQRAYHVREHDPEAFERIVLAKGINTSTIVDYHSCVQGCMTKMLTGTMCGQDETVDDDRVQRAIQVLRGFTFVGITDYWHATVWLFSDMFDIPVTKSDLDIHRPSRFNRTTKEDAAVQLQNMTYVDDTLFAVALKSFKEKILALMRNELTESGQMLREDMLLSLTDVLGSP